MASPAAEALAAKLGTDPELVEQILASQGDPSTGGPFTGFARCLNSGCDLFDSDREVAMVREFTERRADDVPVVTSSASHFHLVNDGDGSCPECGEPCALLDQPRRVIPRYV